MKDKDLVNAVIKLKRDTGNEIDVIGMSCETNNVVLNVYGEMQSDHEMIVDQCLFKNKKKWHSVELCEAHIKAIEIVFRAEVEKVKEAYKIEGESEMESEQYAKDVQRFGRPDVLFNDFY